MRFFEKYFGEISNINSKGEGAVFCPFPHKQPDGTEHIEKIPSAHINTDKSTFHCKAPHCTSKHAAGPGGGFSEAGFLSAVQGVSYGEATKILGEMEGNSHKTEQWNIWHTKLKDMIASDTGISSTLEFIGLRDEKLVDELKLGYRNRGIVFPVFIYDEYMGACDYEPFPDEGQGKAILDKGMGQAIFPFDLWREDDRDTFLCAGFKDAAMARLNGLNAITFTHGEGSFPKLYKRMFKGRKVFICYDNDEGGRDGASKSAMLLKEVGAVPVIVDISSVCTEKGEDIHDFYQMYGKTTEDLEKLAHASQVFTEESYNKQRNKEYPLVSLQQSTSGKSVGRILSSRISVVADHSETYRVPDVVEFRGTDKTKQLDENEVILFTLEESNIEDILYLVDSGLGEGAIYNNLKSLVGLSSKEPCIIRELSWTNVHKAVVVDDVEASILDSMDESYSPLEMTVYSIGDEGKLTNGNKYRIFYKAVPHPYKAREIVGVLTLIESSDTAVSAFRVTPEVLESLKCFQAEKGELAKKMEELYERSKAFLGPEANWPVFMTTELFYHTPLEFRVDANRTERAYLEPMIVGESRTHKSATAKGMVNMYGLGTFVSLKNATVAGLIGGSQGSSNGGYKTRLGIIPRNHKGAVILEEFSGAPPDFIKQMTDIRSSNMVRINRVSGTTTAPAKVRMLTLSNAKASQTGTTLPLTQYSSGVPVLLDLLGLAEDINRYDFFVLKGEGKMVNPNTKIKIPAFEQEAYQNRVRWIWSRHLDQVSLTEDNLNYIIECADDLTKLYGTHIKFFGPEAWKKVSRVAIATAACVCSYDETGENLVITEEHILWAKKFLVSCYDNPIFKMRSYVDGERAYSKCDKNDVQLLEGLHNRNSALITHLADGTEFSQQQLLSVSGLNGKEFGAVISQLTGGKFIKWVRGHIQPTPKFRTALSQINQSGTTLQRV